MILTLKQLNHFAQRVAQCVTQRVAQRVAQCVAQRVAQRVAQLKNDDSVK